MSSQDPLFFPAFVSGSGELDGENMLLQVSLRLRLDEIVDEEAEQLRLSARSAPTEKELRRLAYTIYSNRRLRDRVADRRLFGEPAWDMLLALYCLPPRGEMLTVTTLSYAADCPQSTGLRWQKVLSESGLIERGPDGIDGRRKFIRLTADGKQLMLRVLSRLHSTSELGCAKCLKRVAS